MSAQPTTARGLDGGARPRTAVLDVTVLLGGPSSEREVSLLSGRAVADALARSGHRVTTADIRPEEVAALDREGLEVVFIALHGEFGENGQVQRLCEDRGLVYVGSGPGASHLAMEKTLAKQRFREAGLDTPDWALVDGLMPERRRQALLERLGLPCVLKPVDGGSSLDVTIARSVPDRRRGLDGLLSTYGRALVERLVQGREMAVSILGGRPLPVMEIRTPREFYDYYAKYEDDATEYLVASDLPASVDERLRAAAVEAHRTLGCRDFSRVDFILADDGTAQVLEVNTIPGFTSHSLLPKAAVAAGVGFDELCDRIVRMALRRAGR